MKKFSEYSKSKYYMQPDGTWKRGGDGRSVGKTKAELLAMGKQSKIREGLLYERYKNAVGDSPLKAQYADQVWELLQKSYAAIGGIKGNGFESKQRMIDKIPFWKMAIKGGKVEAVVLYKDKGGRKSVAVGSTGSDWAKQKIAEMMKADIERSYGEKSKAALGAMLKLFPQEALEPFIMRPRQVMKIVGRKERITPIHRVPKDKWPDDAKLTLTKYPWLLYYGYIREIGGKPTFKVMIGTPGNNIR